MVFLSAALRYVGVRCVGLGRTSFAEVRFFVEKPKMARMLQESDRSLEIGVCRDLWGVEGAMGEKRFWRTGATRGVDSIHFLHCAKFGLGGYCA